MLQFQPPGFGQRVFTTSLGVMAYYTPIAAPWRSTPDELKDEGINHEPTAHDESNLPPLVFLHSLGGGSSAYEWSKVYPAFAVDHRVIAPDWIGWGHSSHPAKAYRLDDYFIILTELLEQVGSPAKVVASSLTAGITVQLAIQRPDLFRSLFLVCPAGYGEAGANYSQGIAAQLASTPGIDRLLYAVGAGNEWAVRTFMENILFADRSRITNEMVAAYVASAQQFNAEFAALASLRGTLCFDLEQFIGQLQVPTSIIWGDRSRFGRPALAQQLGQLNQQAIREVVVIPNVGVLPHLETPAVVIGLLRRSLQALS